VRVRYPRALCSSSLGANPFGRSSALRSTTLSIYVGARGLVFPLVERVPLEEGKASLAYCLRPLIPTHPRKGISLDELDSLSRKISMGWRFHDDDVVLASRASVDRVGSRTVCSNSQQTWTHVPYIETSHLDTVD
jgi:hypothetical protein